MTKVHRSHCRCRHCSIQYLGYGYDFDDVDGQQSVEVTTEADFLHADSQICDAAGEEQKEARQEEEWERV